MNNDEKLSRNAAFDNVDDLLNAQMDDLDDLPPMEVPPTGNYLVKTVVERKEVNDKDALVTSYEIIEILEVADEAELGAVVIGQSWQNGTYLKKKDGKPNSFGIAAFKGSLVPYAQHFYPDTWKTTTLGDIISKMGDGVLTNISLKRVQRKGGDDDQYNARIKSAIVV